MSTSSTASSTAFVPPTPFVEPTARWVRVKFGGEIIADSRHALLFSQYGPTGFPTYYFPQADVRMERLASDAANTESSEFDYHTVTVGDKTRHKAAWIYRQPPAEFAALQDLVSFRWGAMDAWFEEDEEMFVHARDPHKRVDVLPSSRHIRVEIGGVTVAETRRPALLFETSLPTRYYIPLEDIRLDLFEPTSLTTRCPYKGQARYWSFKQGDRVVQNIVWSYPDPIPECPKIKGLLSFYNERVDLYVDGDLQERPITPWS